MFTIVFYNLFFFPLLSYILWVFPSVVKYSSAVVVLKLLGSGLFYTLKLLNAPKAFPNVGHND